MPTASPKVEAKPVNDCDGSVSHKDAVRKPLLGGEKRKEKERWREVGVFK